jgi:tetratricopeptide (TPR) repeat protein
MSNKRSFQPPLAGWIRQAVGSFTALSAEGGIRPVYVGFGRASSTAMVRPVYGPPIRPLLTLVIACALGSAAAAFDTVKTRKGSAYGEIIGMDADKVEIRQSSGNALTKQVPVNEIQAVLYEGEPMDLKTARNHVLAGRFAEASTALQKIDKTPSRREIAQDIEFYKALCAAKLALAGKMKIADAGRMMKAFADAHSKSYHYYEASEVVGDLLVAVGSYAPAVDYYARLEAAPWPDYRMRAGVAVGRALLSQGKIEEALAAFDKVLAIAAEGDAVQQQRLAATLGKAAALVASKKPDEAIKIVDDLLEKADPENASLMSRAYNIRGAAQRQAGRIMPAILDFLHVDILYASAHDAHAEALANLADLWEQDHKIERANRARKALEERYPESPWAKKGGNP